MTPIVSGEGIRSAGNINLRLSSRCHWAVSSMGRANMEARLTIDGRIRIVILSGAGTPCGTSAATILCLALHPLRGRAATSGRRGPPGLRGGADRPRRAGDGRAGERAALRLLQMAVDWAIGAAAPVNLDVLAERSGAVRPVGPAADGSGTNDGCASTSPVEAAGAVVPAGADLGLADDGDAYQVVAARHTGAGADCETPLAILEAHLRRWRGLRTIATARLASLGCAPGNPRRHQGRRLPRRRPPRLQRAVRASPPMAGEPSGTCCSPPTRAQYTPLASVQVLAVVRSTGPRRADLATVLGRVPRVVINVTPADRDRLGPAALRGGRRGHPPRRVEARPGPPRVADEPVSRYRWPTLKRRGGQSSSASPSLRTTAPLEDDGM